jgi:hypothetical protein
MSRRDNRSTSRPDGDAVARTTRIHQSTTELDGENLIETWDDDNYNLRRIIWEQQDEVLRHIWMAEDDPDYFREFKESFQNDDRINAEAVIKCLRAWRKKWGDCSQVINAYMQRDGIDHSKLTRDVRRRQRLNAQLEDRWRGWLQEVKEGKRPSWKEKDMCLNAGLCKW